MNNLQKGNIAKEIIYALWRYVFRKSNKSPATGDLLRSEERKEYIIVIIIVLQ